MGGLRYLVHKMRQEIRAGRPGPSGSHAGWFRGQVRVEQLSQSSLSSDRGGGAMMVGHRKRWGLLENAGASGQPLWED